MLSELIVFWQGLAAPVNHSEYPDLVVLHAVDNSKRVDEQFSNIGATVFWNYILELSIQIPENAQAVKVVRVS